MRWNQAKSLMILLFLGLNAVLGYYNFVRPARIMALRSESEAIYRLALQGLQELGLTVAEKPDTTVRSLAAIQLRNGNAATSAQALATRFFGTALTEVHQERLQTLSGGVIWRYQKKDEILEIASDGRYTYRDETPFENIADATSLSFPQAEAMAVAFLKQRGEDLVDLSPMHDLTQVLNDAIGEYRLAWCAEYKGFPIFDAELSVVLRNGRVIRVNSTIRAVDDEIETPLWLGNANDVLLRLTSDEQVYRLAEQAQAEGKPLVVQNVYLGYFTQNRVSAPEFEAIEAFPTWRVLFSNGQVLYFDALSIRRIYP